MEDRDREEELRLYWGDLMKRMVADLLAMAEDQHWAVEDQHWAVEDLDLEVKVLRHQYEEMQRKLEALQQRWKGDSDPDDSDESSGSIPLEIAARGPLAIGVYKRALSEGATSIKRFPVMLIGQGRTGKTSLKKSLKGETFHADEKSTEGIETDPSHFKVSTELWRAGMKDQETGSESNFLFDHQAAQLIFRSLKEDETNVQDVEESPGTEQNIPVPISESSSSDSMTDSGREETKGKHGSFFRPQPSAKKATLHEEQHDGIPFAAKVPDDIAKLLQKLIANDENVGDEDEIYSVLWDFGGQSVYYATHPIFLTEKALYILTCDLSLNPYDKAETPVRQGIFKEKEDIFCNRTNLDYLDFWMTSVYSLVSPDAPCQDPPVASASSTKLPPVFLVCTHADKPHRDADPREMALEIYGFLQSKIYGGHLFKDVFVVDNTKSGSENECPEVVRLREEVLAYAKQLPQMKEVIPLKWLLYEKNIQLLRKEGYTWMHIEEAREIATGKCGIDDEEHFRTLLNFLHDQRFLIHFSETPDLENMVILDPQWLINVFKRVITIKRYEYSEKFFLELWLKLEEKGILDERLLHHAWKSLFESQETYRSLIAIMERFSLLCSWPSQDDHKQYFVPSMLMTPPTDAVLELLTSAQIPSLFVRFDSGRVPPGLFSRLVLQFYQWSKVEWKSTLNPELFHNFVQFHILPHQGTSVIFLCHPSCIEIVVFSGNGAVEEREAGLNHGNLDVTISRSIHRQLRMILECMRKEFAWLKNMRYEMCVCCPVCSQDGSVKCRAHGVRGCAECLHLLSEKDLQKCQHCIRPGVRGDCRIRTKMFEPWFSFSDAQRHRISLKQEQAASGPAFNERSIVSSKDGAHRAPLALPAGVLGSIQSQSCDPKEVVVWLQECLQLNQTTLENPDPEAKRWIRCLANAAKSEWRKDVVKHLRTIVPAGTTGPLLPEDLDVGCIPFKQRKELTFSLCGGNEWKLLAERLGMSYNEIRFLDKRVTNPCDVVLNIMAQHRHFRVGDLYDKLVEIELPGAADYL